MLLRPAVHCKSAQDLRVEVKQRFTRCITYLKPTIQKLSYRLMPLYEFNSLDRAAALHNVRILCPTIATYAINTYREPARLFIIGGKELRSEEDATQGDPLAMYLYAVSVQPFIIRLNASTFVKQCWFAADDTGAGSLGELKKWWGELNESGPCLGYFPNAKKCRLIVKPEKEEAARDLFRQTLINISTQAQKHLGAVLGSRSYLDEYVSERWIIGLANHKPAMRHIPSV